MQRGQQGLSVAHQGGDEDLVARRCCMPTQVCKVCQVCLHFDFAALCRLRAPHTSRARHIRHNSPAAQSESSQASTLRCSTYAPPLRSRGTRRAISQCLAARHWGFEAGPSVRSTPPGRLQAENTVRTWAGDGTRFRPMRVSRRQRWEGHSCIPSGSTAVWEAWSVSRSGC